MAMCFDTSFPFNLLGAAEGWATVRGLPVGVNMIDRPGGATGDRIGTRIA